MLDPWIIEEIRRREEEKRREDNVQRIRVPMERPDQRDSKTPKTPPAEEPGRGVTVIDL